MRTRRSTHWHCTARRCLMACSRHRLLRSSGTSRRAAQLSADGCGCNNKNMLGSNKITRKGKQANKTESKCSPPRPTAHQAVAVGILVDTTGVAALARAAAAAVDEHLGCELDFWPSVLAKNIQTVAQCRRCAMSPTRAAAKTRVRGRERYSNYTLALSCRMKSD